MRLRYRFHASDLSQPYEQAALRRMGFVPHREGLLSPVYTLEAVSVHDLRPEGLVLVPQVTWERAQAFATK